MEKNIAYLNDSYLFGNDIYCNLSIVNDVYPLHFHEFFEIELVIEGEGYETINGVQEPVKTGTLFLFHPTDYHSIKATKPLKLYNIAFTNSIVNEEVIRDFLEYEQNIKLELSPNKLNQIYLTVELMNEIFLSNRTNKASILVHLLNALILLIVGSSKRELISKGSTKVDILKYIHMNYAKNPTLDEISDYCGYQKNYFCDYFKKNTGCTYKDYLNSIRINQAKKLLKISKKTINEIAYETGFNSANNFIREFKLKTNTTPNQYRRLYLDTTSK